MKNIKEACAAVADVFEGNPDAWTREFFARDECGIPAACGDHRAVQWCVIGAVMAAMETGISSPIRSALDPIANQLGYPNAADANNIGGRLVAIKMLRMAAA